MTRTHKIANLIGVPLPLVGLVAAIVLLWNQAVGPLELGLLIGLYVLTALGCCASEGGPVGWVADHRKHHAHADDEHDVHTPNCGFRWAHLLW